MSENLPYLFIGSSTEGEPIAEAIQANLRDFCETKIWCQGVFLPMEYTLQSLVKELEKLDFAILIFTPDDFTESRGQGQQSPRDNILIEVGLLIGSLGRERTFVVYDKSRDMKIPSDLAGISLLGYSPPNRATLEAALGPACYSIKQAIKDRGLRKAAIAAPLPPPRPPRSDTELQQIIDSNSDIFGFDQGPPSLDIWYRDLRPLIQQSIVYTAPTYFLDKNLNIIDWNIAFDLIFSEIADNLRYRHVNEFIVRLTNDVDVFGHAREFTRNVEKGSLPLVDIEKLKYRSERYGEIIVCKLATPLYGKSGNTCGWSVVLLPEKINWELLVQDIEQRFRESKMWDHYSYSYDEILNNFPPYQKLLSDVASIIPDSASTVVDAGAGTGNSTEVLLKRGFHVTSIESSAGMIGRMREKHFDQSYHRIIKASVDSLDTLERLEAESFDGATLVNVLYSLEKPSRCLKGVHRLLKPNGVLGISTTHSDVNLEPLLEKIKKHLINNNLFDNLRSNYKQLYEINKRIERDIARRYSADDYINMVTSAGFEVLRREDFTYEGAVMLIHARKIG